MEIIFYISAIVAIIIGIPKILKIFKNKKYAVYIEIDSNLIESDKDLAEIKGIIKNLINIKYDIKISVINSNKLKVNLKNRMNY